MQPCGAEGGTQGLATSLFLKMQAVDCTQTAGRGRGRLPGSHTPKPRDQEEEILLMGFLRICPAKPRFLMN